MAMVRVAMCQIFVLDGDRPGNFVRIENAVRQAKELGPEIVCLPETVVLGWVNPDAHERAHPVPGEDSERLCGLARKYRVYLCVGLEEKDGPHLFDSAILVNNRGEIILKHRKINTMPELMSPPYSAGTEVDTVRTKFGRIGLLICADTHDDRILARMADMRPDLLLVPYGYAAPQDDWPGHGGQLAAVVTKAAMTVGAPVVGTNLVGEITHGPWRGRIYGGQSVAADKNGSIIAAAADRDRDIKVVSISVCR